MTAVRSSASPRSAHLAEATASIVVRIGRRAPLVIEAPHPVSDQSSELVAAAVFADTQAEALIVAGTRRDAAPDGSADAAHAETTAFAAVDQRLSVPGVTVVQIHGFATAKHPGYPQVVLSDSTPAPGRWLTALAQALQRAGFSTCVFDGSVCRELGATHNVEAAHAQASGARFVHVELADGARQSFDARRRVSAALAHALQGHPRSGPAQGSGLGLGVWLEVRVRLGAAVPHGVRARRRRPGRPPRARSRPAARAAARAPQNASPAPVVSTTSSAGTGTASNRSPSHWQPAAPKVTSTEPGTTPESASRSASCSLTTSGSARAATSGGRAAYGAALTTTLAPRACAARAAWATVVKRHLELEQHDVARAHARTGRGRDLGIGPRDHHDGVLAVRHRR